MRERWLSRATRETGQGLSLGLVILLGVIVVLPFLYMVTTSLMDEFEVLRTPPALLPGHPRFGNYSAVLTALPFWRFFLNSGVVAVCVVAGTVAISVMG